MNHWSSIGELGVFAKIVLVGLEGKMMAVNNISIESKESDAWARCLRFLELVRAIVRPRQELQFFEFFGSPERVEMVTKDLSHPNIFHKPLIRDARAWILRRFSVVKALQRPGQNYQNSGFFVVPGGVVLVAKDLAPERILNKPCTRKAQT